MATPATTAKVTMTAVKAIAARLPCRLLSRPSVEMLVAGPVIRKSDPRARRQPGGEKRGDQRRGRGRAHVGRKAQEGEEKDIGHRREAA